MNRTLSLLSAAALAMLVAACGKTSEPPKPKTPPPPKETVFDGMISNKQRAQQTTDRATEVDRQNHEAAMKEIDGPATSE
jgi:hypothetical protein